MLDMLSITKLGTRKPEYKISTELFIRHVKSRSSQNIKDTLNLCYHIRNIVQLQEKFNFQHCTELRVENTECLGNKPSLLLKAIYYPVLKEIQL